MLALLEERERVEAVAGGMIGALLGRLAVGIDGERERARVGEALETLTREAARVGAEREQLEDRSVGTRGGLEIALRLEDLAERDEREDVAGLVGMPLVRLGEGSVAASDRKRSCRERV
ncbi:MAG: hypothetical protein J0I07_36270, partial [Myxococcales bacterium]|nr:hypothetical protein [Myxococcales bacterium]